jgi:hypothetical protein
MLALAVPSLRSFILDNRLASQAAEFTGRRDGLFWHREIPGKHGQLNDVFPSFLCRLG